MLLSKGGPIAKCYGSDARLNKEGINRFGNAIVDKFFLADLVVRALRLQCSRLRRRARIGVSPRGR